MRISSFPCGKGAKGRIEIQASNYLILDAEVFENDDLNGTNYFIGARLNVPFDLTQLAQGKNPFKHPRTTQAETHLRDRLNSQVICDVRVQHEQTDFDENRQRRREASTSSSAVVIQDGVTFVDGDNGGTENGTAENPFDAIGEGVTDAGVDGYVFVYDQSGSYDEGVNLLNGQTLTSSVTGNGGKRYTTTKPKVTHSSQTGSTGVINLASGNTVNRLDVTAINCANCWGIYSTGSTAPTVISNTITNHPGRCDTRVQQQ